MTDNDSACRKTDTGHRTLRRVGFLWLHKEEFHYDTFTLGTSLQRRRGWFLYKRFPDSADHLVERCICNWRAREVSWWCKWRECDGSWTRREIEERRVSWMWSYGAGREINERDQGLSELLHRAKKYWLSRFRHITCFHLSQMPSKAGLKMDASHCSLCRHCRFLREHIASQYTDICA